MDTPADSGMEERDANEAGLVSGNLRWWRMTCEELDGRRGHLQGCTTSLLRVKVRAEMWMA